jgi:hypothetical protein
MLKTNKPMKIETSVRPTPPSGSLFKKFFNGIAVAITNIKESIEDIVTKR